MENYFKIWAGSGFQRKEGRDGGSKGEKIGGMAGSENPIVDPQYISDIKLTYHSITKRIKIFDHDLFNHLRIRHTECHTRATHDKELAILLVIPVECHMDLTSRLDRIWQTV